jgi:copper chaperone CopZ
MSRRRGEFEHRTSIFEGAFRAWSHLGGLEPEDLEGMSSAELDPLTNPLVNDPRLAEGGGKKGSPVPEAADSSGHGGGSRREYPYEPLPRTGLTHPFVQAILSPWLGPDADQDAIQLGLTTLRTWWQHRRKGESGTAIAALGSDKMRGVVEGYTRHFFNLAHCLVVNDNEQPPRTLMQKMKKIEKTRSKKVKKRTREEEADRLAAMAMSAAGAQGIAGLGADGLGGMGGMGMGVDGMGGGVGNFDGAYAGDFSASASSGLDLGASSGAASAAGGCCDGGLNPNLTPLERLHAEQQRQLGAEIDPATGLPKIDVRGKCIPGKLDLPGIINQVSSNASQLAHRGALTSASAATPGAVLSHPGALETASTDAYADPAMAAHVAAQAGQYGDPTKTPVVFVSENGDIQIAMSVDGITCAHCVKIVETVLKGCNGNKSPIDGLLDAAADRALNSVLIKIDRSSSAKRIAFESARNLAMVGYTAIAKEMDIGGGANGGQGLDLGALSKAFDVVATTEKADVFDWTLPCTCPDNGVLREDCSR